MGLYMITAARGPLECQHAAYLLWKKLKKYSVETLQIAEGENKACLLSVIFESDHDDLLQKWKGTHQWIFSSPYRKHHKRKNWFVGLYALSFSTENPFFDEKDVEIKAVRASGPGGQHVNKSSTAIQAKHLPSGISVFVQEERSQYQNKRIAYLRLIEKMSSIIKESEDKEKQKQWNTHFELYRGNPVKTWRI